MDWSLIGKVLLPEGIALVGIMLTLLLSLGKQTKSYVPAVASVSLGLSALVLLTNLLPEVLINTASGKPSISIIADSFKADALSSFFRMLIYFVTFLVSLASAKYLKVLESPGEYYTILITASLGAAFLAGANDLLMLVVALETLGLCSILLTSYARLNQSSNEAGIKYLISSAIATSILLLGLSFLYGVTGSTNFSLISSRIQELIAANAFSYPLQILISVAIVSAIAFKLAAAPFHNWSPDVYSGAPTSTTLFLSVVSKTAAFALAIRLFATVYSNDLIALMLALAAVISIVIGNYIGVYQVISRGSVKKLLAYSSIAQSGYLLIGLSVLKLQSISALVMYLTVYALMNTGAFIALIHFEQETGSDSIYDLAGYIHKRPVVTVVFALCLINLAGLPFIPAGFIAKFFLFSAAFSSGIAFGQLLAIIGLIGSIIGLYYYLYLIKIMVVDSPSTVVSQITDQKDNSNFFSIFTPIRLGLAATLILLIWVGVLNTELVHAVTYGVVGTLGR